MTSISTLSTLQKSQTNRQLIAGQDREIERARKELITGIKADVYADGTYRSAQSLDLRNRMARADAFATSNKLLSEKLDVMNTVIGNIRSGAQEFLALSVSLGGNAQGNETLQFQAQTVLQRTASYLNTIYAGEYLFSGANTSVTSLTLPNTGFPTGTIAAPAGPAEVDAAIAAVNGYFGLGTAYDPASNFAADAYQGSPSLQSAPIDENAAIAYGITAQDESLRQIFKGLTMLAQTDVSVLGTGEAYTTWIREANNAITRGVAGLQAAEVTLGNTEAEVNRTITRQSRLGDLYNNRIVNIEGVDGEEAATRLEALSSQLEASYAVTVRIKNLSLLNYL